MSLKTNREHLVKMSVQGAADHPSGSEVRVDSEGHPFVMPAIGGITYNVRLGDPCFGLVGDHVEPGVSLNCYTGDYDLMTIDRKEIAQLGLDKLRFGDFVFLQDCDNTYGRGYLHDAVAIGLVIHSDCIVSGHGPGISTVLACKTPMLVPKIDPEANLLKYHNIVMKKQKR